MPLEEKTYDVESNNDWAKNVKGEHLYIDNAISGHKGYYCFGCDKEMDAYEFYKVTKLRFLKKKTINYNRRIKLNNIPEKVYEYFVNGKGLICWIKDRYQVSVDTKSGVKNDPNDWNKEVENPSYILDLILSFINVSVQRWILLNHYQN